MSHFCYKRWFFTLGLMLALLTGITLLGFTQTAQAARGGEHRGGHQEFRDSHYDHNHNYPSRGQYISALPSGHRVVFHGNSRYYFHGGVWYRPYGRRFIVVAPPFGLFVPFLPLYYTTIWVGGYSYYYANEIYYRQSADGYVVVEPPKGDVSQTAPSTSQPSPGQTSTDRLFIYPRQGQSEQKQATDRYECHRWAVSQAGYDPTQPPATMPADQLSNKRADYQRAMGACLDGRGYTVK